MFSNDKSSPQVIQSVLICGCGLIGTSLALAWQDAGLPIQVYGLEVLPAHRAQAIQTGAFVEVLESIPTRLFDLVVLATPVDAACKQMAALHQQSVWMMDVCSVKQPLTDAALKLSRHKTFAPTHPMAGLAAEGPIHATPTLFKGRPWICLEGWPACTVVQPLIEKTGAHVVQVASSQDHDAAMAAVSHGIHLSSLMNMLTYNELQPDGQSWANLTGPAFRDVTRLSSSPSGFWVSTLLANRQNVLHALHSYASQLVAFQAALERGDAEALRKMLDSARAARKQWEGEHTCQ